jgi:hypothetical protein
MVIHNIYAMLFASDMNVLLCPDNLDFGNATK